MVKTRFRLTRMQKKIVNCKAKCVLALTDRRFGKEYVCLAKALKECRKKFSVVVWVTFNKQMKEAIEDFVIMYCEELSVDNDCITFRNGSRLYFSSCNVNITDCNIYNITRGMSPTLMIFDECGFFTRDQWHFTFDAAYKNSCKKLFISSVYKNNTEGINPSDMGSFDDIKLIDYRYFNKF